MAGRHQIKRGVCRIGGRPVWQSDPLVRARVEAVHFSDFRNVAFVFQEVIEEWQLKMLAIINAGLAAEISRPQPIAVRPRPATMKPWPHHQHVEDSRILLLDVLVSRERAEEIFVIVPTANRHHRGMNVSQVRENVSIFPILIVIRMLHHFVPELDAKSELLLISVAEILQPAYVVIKLVAVLRPVIERLHIVVV